MIWNINDYNWYRSVVNCDNCKKQERRNDVNKFIFFCMKLFRATMVLAQLLNFNQWTRIAFGQSRLKIVVFFLSFSLHFNEMTSCNIAAIEAINYFSFHHFCVDVAISTKIRWRRRFKYTTQNCRYMERSKFTSCIPRKWKKILRIVENYALGFLSFSMFCFIEEKEDCCWLKLLFSFYFFLLFFSFILNTLLKEMLLAMCATTAASAAVCCCSCV